LTVMTMMPVPKILAMSMMDAYIPEFLAMMILPVLMTIVPVN